MGTAEAVLIAWIPLCAFLFAMTHPARACVLAFLVGWLALPMAELRFIGLPDIDKVLATSGGVVLGVLLFCPRRLLSFRPRMGDWLVVLFAGSTGVTSLTNELGTYDGGSAFFQKLLYYGVPYMLGRAFILTREELRSAARIIVVGAGVYGLLALYEWRMSPQIHNLLYGFFPHSWLLGLRWGWFRPIVCFPSTLALGSFFAWTALLGVWMARHRLLDRIGGMPAMLMAVLPVLGLLTSMSFGPWALFLSGIVLLGLFRWRRSSWVAAAPVLFALFWMVGRYGGWTNGAWMSDAVANLSPTRASSLQYRIDAETMFIDRAKEQPMFGWGTWGRNRITNDQGRDVVASDGLWIIYLSAYGVIGLGAFYLWWVWPVLLVRSVAPAVSADPVLSAVVAVCGLQAVNFLFNAFLDPSLTLICGGAATQLIALRSRSVEGRPAAQARAVPLVMKRVPSA